MMELVAPFTKDSFESVVIVSRRSGLSCDLLLGVLLSGPWRLRSIMRCIKITVDIRKAAQIKRFGHLWVEANWASWLYSAPLWDWESKPSVLITVPHWDFHSLLIDNKTTLRSPALAVGIAETLTIELFTTPLTLCNYTGSARAEFASN